MTPNMRRKSLNPKKLFLKDEAATEVDKPELCDVGSLNVVSLVQQTQSIEMKSEMNNNLNGSDAGKAGGPPNNDIKRNHGTSEIFSFENVPCETFPRKCSCYAVRKDQTTQTPGDVKEWLDSATLPSAVNPAAVEPSSLPSPGWSQSSDSEGSLPRTPNKLKLYKCKVCEKAFPTPSKLRRHFLIHSGEKPYSCRVCAKPFNDPANLKRHHWSHIKEKPFICEECHGEFMTKRDAMMHLCPAVKRKRK